MNTDAVLPQLRYLIDNTKLSKTQLAEQTSLTNIKHQSNEILVLNCCATETQSYIVVGGNNPTMQVYSLKTGILIKEMEGHTDSVTCMVVDGLILITGSDDGSIRLWNLENFTPSGVVGYHEAAVRSLLIIQESGLLLSVGLERDVKCWVY